MTIRRPWIPLPSGYFQRFFHLIRHKGMVFGLQALAWKLKTAWFKQRIYIEDRFGLFNYAKWRKQTQSSVKVSQANEPLKSGHRPLLSFMILTEENQAAEPVLSKHVRSKDCAEGLGSTYQALCNQIRPDWQALLVSNNLIDMSQNTEKISTSWSWPVLACPGHSQGDQASDLRKAFLSGGDERFSDMTGMSLIQVLDAATGEFVMLVYPGDQPAPGLIDQVIALLSRHPQADIIYFDEDHVVNTDWSWHSQGGTTYHEPFFKPDWSPELIFSINYLEHALIRRSILMETWDALIDNTGQVPLHGGVQSLPRNKLDYQDLILASTQKATGIHHIPQVLYHQKTQPPNCIRLNNRPIFHCQKLEAHLQRSGVPAPKASLSKNGQIHLTWPVQQRLVSIIIPTRDRVQILQKCLETLQNLTTYHPYEILLVDSGSQESTTQAYYQTLLNNNLFPLKIIDYQHPGGFNFSASLNAGVQHASGEILLFLNNDTEVIDPEWLTELVRWLEFPQVGIVGAKLLYPDKTIQHAGIIIGLEGHASHVFGGAPGDACGPFGSVNWYRNYSAVTGACMAIPSNIFEQIGGFSEAYQLVFSDIDICLRAIQAGYRVVYTPYARLIHHEGKTRAQYMPDQDIQLGFQQLEHLIESGDPYFNPNLSYAVRIPTLARPGEETAIQRLSNIVKYW